jgi:hypothetical protein
MGTESGGEGEGGNVERRRKNRRKTFEKRNGMTNKIEGGEKQASDDQPSQNDTSAISSSISFQIEPRS